MNSQEGWSRIKELALSMFESQGISKDDISFAQDLDGTLSIVYKGQKADFQDKELIRTCVNVMFASRRQCQSCGRIDPQERRLQRHNMEPVSVLCDQCLAQVSEESNP